MEITATPYGPRCGLTAREASRVTPAAIIAATIADDSDELKFARNITEQVGRVTGQQTTSIGSFLLPADSLQRRDLTVGGGGASGGYLVPTEGVAFADSLRAASVTLRLAPRVLPALTADATIGVEATKVAAGWAPEEVAASTGEPVFGQVILTPRIVSAKLVLSRQMALQTSPAGRAWLDSLLAAALGEALDAVLLVGTGANGQPKGIGTLSGIDSRVGGSFALSDAAAMLRVADGYASSDSARWVAGVAAAETLRRRPKASGGELMLLADDGKMLGRDVLVSRSLPAQALAVMPWSELLVGSWGGIELLVDRLTLFASGRVQILARWFVDLSPTRPAQIAYASGVA